jgi:hypothetical protein
MSFFFGWKLYLTPLLLFSDLNSVSILDWTGEVDLGSTLALSDSIYEIADIASSSTE